MVDDVLVGALVTAGVIALSLMGSIAFIILRDHPPQRVRQRKHKHWRHRRYEDEDVEEPDTEHLAEVIPLSHRRAS